MHLKKTKQPQLNITTAVRLSLPEAPTAADIVEQEAAERGVPLLWLITHADLQPYEDPLHLKRRLRFRVALPGAGDLLTKRMLLN